jgi:carbonic anhydrase/acetyltransferase-like protein (isoleucine patch superfamily)
MALYELDGIVPILPDGETWVAPDAVVIGKVQLDRGASIWFGAVLRGDNELIHIGDGSNVQDHCVLHTDLSFPLVIGQNCTIGHRVTLHGCTIGDHCLIGIGATILNGTRIGRNCIIGAHTLLTENKEIPDNSLVIGSPGRIVRQVDAADIEARKRQALRYENNWRRFAKGLVLRG